MRALLWALLRKVRPRLQRYTLNHNLVQRPRTSSLGRRSHDDLGVLNAVNHPAEHRILLIKGRLLLERDEPLTVGAVDIAGARGTQSPALVRYVAELSRHVWIRRIAGAINRSVISFRQRITALNNSQTRVDAMNRRAVIKLFAGQLLEALDHFG